MLAPKYAFSSIDHLPGALPTLPVPEGTDPNAVGEEMLQKINEQGLCPDFFTHDAFWRDQFALTGSLRTFYGPDRILPAWNALSKTHKPNNYRMTPGSGMNQGNWLTALFSFDTNGELPATCSGILFTVPHGQSGWKIWMFLTLLEDFKEHKGVDLRERYPEAIENGMNGVHLNGQVNGINGTAGNDVYDAIMIGGGQSGLATGAWCQSYGLKYLVLERNAEIGDNWLNRYTSAKLHTGHRFNDLPFGPTFSNDDPEWLTSKALAKGYRNFVKRFHINVWTSAEMTDIARWSEDSKTWTIKVRHAGNDKVLTARHLVIATGPGGTVPLKPAYPGEAGYKGISMHSASYKDSDAWPGKRGIVVGSANTAHDVAEDMVHAGLTSVHMVQRGTTYVVPREHFTSMFNNIWNGHIPSELSDRLFWSAPNGVARHFTFAHFVPLARAEPERFEALTKVGFKTESEGDFIDHLLVRFGGHYMDCGVSQQIVDGLIKMKSDSPIVAFTESGLEFADGSRIDADVIIWCTGFSKDIKFSASQILGDEVVGRLRPYWGLDADGEVNGAFVPSGVPNLWMTGGGCAHARYFTRYVALQIQADVLGHPLDVYKDSPVEAQ